MAKSSRFSATGSSMRPCRFAPSKSAARSVHAILMAATLTVGATALLQPTAVLADAPAPSVYPISWELKFEHDAPKRLVMDIPGQAIPQAYWYITYTVTNNSGQEQTFYPIFEMLTKDGKIVRSDNNIPSRVFDQIKKQEKKQFLESYPAIAGQIRLGEDQARDGVAIWQEPASQMGNFTVFVGGLSGEIQQLKDDKGEAMKGPDGGPIILRKTLQLDYLSPGNSGIEGSAAHETHHEWVMR